MKEKQWLEVYKSSSSNGYYKNGKWYVSQYFSEGYRDDDDEWTEGDWAVDTDDVDYATAIDKAYEEFLDEVIRPYGSIVKFNESNKIGELPENVAEEED